MPPDPTLQASSPTPAHTPAPLPSQRRGIARWAAPSVAALAGVSIGIALFTFHYAEGTSYLSDDPKACVNCHIMQEHYDAWQHASHHANATCNDCHVPHDTVVHKYFVKAEHGYRHSKGFTFNDFHEPIQITPGSREVVVNNCVRCHSSIGSDTTVHARAHEPLYGRLPENIAPAGLVSADCLHCHARVGHGPQR